MVTPAVINIASSSSPSSSPSPQQPCHKLPSARSPSLQVTHSRLPDAFDSPSHDGVEQQSTSWPAAASYSTQIHRKCVPFSHIVTTRFQAAHRSRRRSLGPSGSGWGRVVSVRLCRNRQARSGAGGYGSCCSREAERGIQFIACRSSFVTSVFDVMTDDQNCVTCDV